MPSHSLLISGNSQQTFPINMNISRVHQDYIIINEILIRYNSGFFQIPKYAIQIIGFRLQDCIPRKPDLHI